MSSPNGVSISSIKDGIDPVPSAKKVIEQELSNLLGSAAGMTINGLKATAGLAVVAGEFGGRAAAEAKLILTNDETRGRFSPFKEGLKATYVNVKAAVISQTEHIKSIPVVGEKITKMAGDADTAFRGHFQIDDHQASGHTYWSEKGADVKNVLSQIPNKLAAYRKTDSAPAPDTPKKPKV